MIIGWTGHRPDAFTIEQRNRVIVRIDELLREYKPASIIVGGALGVDTWVAATAAVSGIPYELAVPFEGHHLTWPEEDQKRYQTIVELAEKVTVVCEGGWASIRDNWKYQKRNEYIVDNCDYLIGIWNGSAGGTSNCLRYGIKRDREMQVIDPRELSV